VDRAGHAAGFPLVGLATVDQLDLRQSFVDVANVLNRTNLRNSSYSVDRVGRVFETTESLMPIVPSGGFVFEF